MLTRNLTTRAEFQRTSPQLTYIFQDRRPTITLKATPQKTHNHVCVAYIFSSLSPAIFARNIHDAIQYTQICTSTVLGLCS